MHSNIKIPIMMNSLENKKGFPLSLIFMGEKVTSNRDYNHPAVLFWTFSNSVLLYMLNSSQLTRAEETNFEIIVENRLQYSMQKLNYMNIFSHVRH